MANRLQKFIYFLSAETPILFVFALVWLIEKSDFKAAPVVISWKVPVILIVISVVLLWLFNRSFNFGLKHLQTMRVTASDISGGDTWIVAYVITYLLPLASFQFGEFVKPVVAVIIAVLLITMTFTDFMTPHPWLYLRGFHFYSLDVEGAQSGYHLISKKRIKSAKDVKTVSQIYEFLLIRQG